MRATPVGAIIGAAGAIGGGIISSNAADDAAKAQMEATQRGIDASTKTQMDMFGKAESYAKPYVELGTETLPTLKSLLGLGPEGAEGMMSTLEKYPGYQFALQEGQRGITNQQIGLGSQYSGNALKAAADYNRNMGAGLFSDYFNKVLGVTGAGQTGAMNLGNLATGVGARVGETQFTGNQSIGASESAGILGQAGAWTNAIDQLTGIGTKLPFASKRIF